MQENQSHIRTTNIEIALKTSPNVSKNIRSRLLQYQNMNPHTMAWQFLEDCSKNEPRCTQRLKQLSFIGETYSKYWLNNDLYTLAENKRHSRVKAKYKKIYSIYPDAFKVLQFFFVFPLFVYELWDVNAKARLTKPALDLRQGSVFLKTFTGITESTTDWRGGQSRQIMSPLEHVLDWVWHLAPRHLMERFST